ncbi:MAG: peptide chain release factor N(5)-glutamine methyltransferase [Candidatus Dormibacteraeota bacterium]|nr:peptide chain release factor N(5)-glutamine methyltransferase [Candidatus Dormibacteraeota bacterium]MBV9526420.1 peptide chain release factor N(5)-glutamine methyltransferase [Candidatus Dormibacteraeota bacterium]
MAKRLAAAGFIAARAEARLLAGRAAGDAELLERLLQRRLTGEPLAWIVGSARFCGLHVRVEPGVFVPRSQSEIIARRAASRLPAAGIAIDVCTGSGAVAMVLMRARPDATVIATDIDPVAIACATANGVEARHGDLFEGLPSSLHGSVDVVTAVVPYVPSAELPYLQRDTFTFETPLAYDGGRDGTRLLRRVIRDAARFLRPKGALLLELGGEQAEVLRPHLRRHGFGSVTVLRDSDGDVRGVDARVTPNGIVSRRDGARSRRA